MRAPVALRIREGREWSVVEGNDGRVGFKRGKGEEGNGQGWFRKLLVTEGSGGNAVTPAQPPAFPRNPRVPLQLLVRATPDAAQEVRTGVQVVYFRQQRTG